LFVTTCIKKHCTPGLSRFVHTWAWA